jgi:hypothetical protein
MPTKGRGPSKIASTSNSGEVLPSHLKTNNDGKPPICSRCGTSSTYYPDHDCYWCESCLEYVTGSDEGESGKGVGEDLAISSDEMSRLKVGEQAEGKVPQKSTTTIKIPVSNDGSVVRRRVVRKKIVR